MRLGPTPQQRSTNEVTHLSNTHTHGSKMDLLALSAKKNQIAALIPAKNAQNGKKMLRKDFVFGRVLALILILNTSKLILSAALS